MVGGLCFAGSHFILVWVLLLKFHPIQKLTHLLFSIILLSKLRFPRLRLNSQSIPKPITLALTLPLSYQSCSSHTTCQLIVRLEMQRALKFIPGWTPKLTKTDYTLRNSSNPTLAIGSEKTQELTPSTHTHPIENDHPFISLWENCLHQGLVRILGESQWLAIDVLRRGTSDQLKECTVTIIITVADDMLKTGEMDATIIEVKTFLRAECWPGINLELREGGLSTYNSHKEGIVKRPNLGYSIEPEGGLRNGTLGGYVTLKKAGFPPKTCVLTVGHVVQEPRK